MSQAAEALEVNDEVSSEDEFVAERVRDQQFLQDVIEGLSAEKKFLSPKYFYDEAGSQLFDEICELEEYYPYRTELKLLPTVAQDLSQAFSSKISIVEFGAGSLIKIRPLLAEMENVSEFIPIDISGEHLFQAAHKLRSSFPSVSVKPEQGDFCLPVALPQFDGLRFGFFPGSTIGNFTPEQASAFLKSAKLTLGDDAYMLIGVDTKKSPETLHAAYNDAKGVTAQFNLNILTRINRELDGRVDEQGFDHYAYYNPVAGRIEMHLVSNTDQVMNIASHSISIRSGETIHTECSYKYTKEEFATLAETSGWEIQQTWLADNDLFSMYLLKASS